MLLIFMFENVFYNFLIFRTRRFVGLRFLQINLFEEDFNRNMVEIFDGRSVDQNRLGRLIANSSSAEIQQLYQTTGDTMAVHVHASVSFGSYGFIAEVVKLPVAGLTYPSKFSFLGLFYKDCFQS